MYRNSYINSSDRKILFNKILLSELNLSEFNIDIFFEWTNENQIFSINVKNNKTIKLLINLNVKTEDMFKGSLYEQELTIRYRSYFIVGYLHYLDDIYDASPIDYFNGLVVLELINDLLCNHTMVLHSPIMKDKIREVRVLDVYCSIFAIRTIIDQYDHMLSSDNINKCKNELLVLEMFSLLPETVCTKFRVFEYSALRDFNNINIIFNENKHYLENYAIFNKFSIMSFDNYMISDVFSNKFNNQFWIDFFLRIYVLYSKKNSQIILDDYPHLIDRINSFKCNSVNYFSFYKGCNNILIEKNLHTIKKLILEIEHAFNLKSSIKSGSLHFIS